MNRSSPHAPLRHPQTGPRRTLPAAQESRKLLGLQRRYPVWGLPSSRFADK
jgi:hypothetical protein